MICAKFVWYWPSGSGEEDFSNLSMYFYYLVINPLKFSSETQNPQANKQTTNNRG